MGKPLESFSTRLRDALNFRDMTQSELCRLSDTPKSSMSQYLSGRNQPKQDRIYTFATILRVNPVWLLGYNVDREFSALEPQQSPDELVFRVPISEEQSIEDIEHLLQKCNLSDLDRISAFVEYLKVVKQNEKNETLV